MNKADKPFDLGLPKAEKARVGIRRIDDEARESAYGRLRLRFSTMLTKGVTAGIKP